MVFTLACEKRNLKESPVLCKKWDEIERYVKSMSKVRDIVKGVPSALYLK